MKFTASLLTAASAFALVAAQDTTDYTCLTTTQLRALTPSCALVCQAEALAATTCDYEDLACNCAQTGKIQQVIEPCLADPARSNCTADEVNAFAGIVVPVCTQLNATTPAEIQAECEPASDPSYSSYSSQVHVYEPSLESSTPVAPVVTETYTTLCTSSYPSYSSYSSYVHVHKLSRKSSTPVAPVVTVSSSSAYVYSKPSAPVYKVWNATTPVVAATGTGVWPVAFTGAANVAGVASGALALAMGAILL